jgi:hypothetical protein
MNPRKKLRPGTTVCECKYTFSSNLCVCDSQQAIRKPFCTVFVSVLFTGSLMDLNERNFSDRCSYLKLVQKEPLKLSEILIGFYSTTFPETEAVSGNRINY